MERTADSSKTVRFRPATSTRCASRSGGILAHLMKKDQSLEISIGELTASQKDALILFFQRLQYDGNIGHSELIGFYADGDGAFQPNIHIDNCNCLDASTCKNISDDDVKIMEKVLTKDRKIDIYIDEDCVNKLQNLPDYKKVKILKEN